MPIEVAAWIAVTAFTVLVIVIIAALYCMVLKMRTLVQTAADMKNDISRLSNELTVLIQHTNETVKVAQDGINAANQVMHATKQISQSISYTSKAVEEITHKAAQKVNRLLTAEAADHRLEGAAQWAELALSAWKLWQQGSEVKEGK